jgi:hypothetical protein
MIGVKAEDGLAKKKQTPTLSQGTSGKPID